MCVWRMGGGASVAMMNKKDERALPCKKPHVTKNGSEIIPFMSIEAEIFPQSLRDNVSGDLPNIFPKFLVYAMVSRVRMDVSELSPNQTPSTHC